MQVAAARPGRDRRRGKQEITRLAEDAARPLSRLRRIATFIREVGVEVTFHLKSARGQRLLTIERTSQTTAVTAATATVTVDD